MFLVIFNFSLDNKPKGLARGFNGIVRGALHSVAEFWHRIIMPRAFSNSAQSEFNFKLRDPEWEKDKKRILGRPAQDRVLSGQTARFVGHSPRITATANKATVRMQIPSKLLGRRNADTPRVQEEIVQVSERGRKEMHQHIAEKIAAGVQDKLNNKG